MDEEEDTQEDQDSPYSRPRSRQIRRAALAKKPQPRQQIGRGGGRILAREKQRRALELRKSGATYDSIAQVLGYSDSSGARKAVQRAFTDITQEPALELKTLQVERLNHMLLAIWPQVQAGDTRGIDTALRVIDKIDRLMGTDAAQAVDVNVQHSGAVLVVDGDRDAFIQAMKRMAGVAGTGVGSGIPNTPGMAGGAGDHDLKELQEYTDRADGIITTTAEEMPQLLPHDAGYGPEFGDDPLNTPGARETPTTNGNGNGNGNGTNGHHPSPPRFDFSVEADPEEETGLDG